MIRLRNQFVWLAGLVFAAATVAVAKQPPQATQPAAADPIVTAPLTQQMPVDPEVIIGNLPNGLRYYVRPNIRPAKRAELRLVVKAGSVLEDDDQRGLAHFVEHMAFDGTRNFPRGDVVAFMQSLGMKFGAHVNAYTSFDETVFMLTVPTDDARVLDRSMLVLEDWAHNVTFDPSQIDKERGVVQEEWRLGLGADARIREKQFPVILQRSRYAERLPIGTMDVVRNFAPDRLRQFYRDWYRPNLMAVIAVGDFDPPAMERLIKAHFTNLGNPMPERQRPLYDVPDHPGTVYAIATDKEATSTIVEVQDLLPARAQGPIGEYRDEIIDHLFAGMLSERLSELAQKADAPFLDAIANRGLFLARTREEATLAAVVKEDGIERGLQALLSEAGRVVRFGFTATELERQKQFLLRQYERIVAERQARESRSRAEEYTRNFLQNEPLPTVEQEYLLHKRFLPGITLAEVNQKSKEWFQDRSRKIVVSAPQKTGVAVPTEASISAIVRAATSTDLKAYVDTAPTSPLLEPAPKAGSIVSESTIASAGITEWTLSNGAKVVLKPTNFHDDEILMRAVGFGGTSLASDPDYIPASTATDVVNASGLGQFSNTDLQKVLAGKIVAVRPFIDEFDQGIVGTSSPKDVETMLQLLYLNFTQPRADATAFRVVAAQTRAALANQTASPEFAFNDTLTNVLNQNHPRRRNPTPADVDSWNLDKSLAFFKARFADAANFTFVFVGSFDAATMKPLVEKYIASLPSLPRHETWRDINVHLPTGVVQKRIEQGIDPKGEIALVFTGPFPINDELHRVTFRAMGQALQAQLMTSLRDELGGAYSIAVNPSIDRIPRGEYSLTIDFTCDPERADSLVARVFREIDRLKTNGPSTSLMRDLREGFSREFETNIRENAYLLRQISQAYELREDVTNVWSMPDVFRAVTTADVQDAARRYLKIDNYVDVRLYPAKK